MALPVYTDLNIPFTSQDSAYAVTELSLSVGFERIAFNYVVSSLQSNKAKKKAQTQSMLTHSPSDIVLGSASLAAIKEKYPKFQQLSRITAILSDAANTHKLSSPEVQAYDIIAVQPTDEKTFMMACSTLEVDIICLNFSENLGFSLKRPLVKLAIKRGIHFEISFSPALKDNSVKRSIISNAVSLIEICRGRGVIISSGAEQPIDVRSPWDVVNLGNLFGLNKGQAKDAMCKNCRAVLKHAETRKTFKSVISVSESSQLRPAEQWILQPGRTGTMDSGKDSTDASEEEESESDALDSDEQTTEDFDSLGHSKQKKIKLDAS